MRIIPQPGFLIRGHAAPERAKERLSPKRQDCHFVHPLLCRNRELFAKLCAIGAIKSPFSKVLVANEDYGGRAWRKLSLFILVNYCLRILIVIIEKMKKKKQKRRKKAPMSFRFHVLICPYLLDSCFCFSSLRKYLQLKMKCPPKIIITTSAIFGLK